MVAGQEVGPGGGFPRRRIGRTAIEVTVLGFGGAPLGGLFEPVSEEDARATLDAALDAGIGYVDTAPFTAMASSERRVGDGLRGRDGVLSTKVGRLLQPGALPRDQLRHWPQALPFTPVFDYTGAGIRRSWEDSLQRLGRDRVDILLVHDLDLPTHGAAKARHLRDLRDSGYGGAGRVAPLRRGGAIGLGVNAALICREALDFGDWDVFLLAGRYTLLEQDPVADLLPACLAAGTSLVIGGPFNSGLLVGGDTYDYAATPPAIAARVSPAAAAAARHGVPLPAAALQFPLAHPAVAAVIPGLRNRRELAEALAWCDTAIPAAFWADLRRRGADPCRCAGADGQSLPPRLTRAASRRFELARPGVLAHAQGGDRGQSRGGRSKRPMSRAADTRRRDAPGRNSGCRAVAGGRQHRGAAVRADHPGAADPAPPPRIATGWPPSSARKAIRWTWAEFAARVDALAGGLLRLGLGKGDRLGIWAPNRAEWLLTQFATARIGVILVNINPAYRVFELEFALRKTGCTALILAERFKSSDYVGMIRDVCARARPCRPGALARRANCPPCAASSPAARPAIPAASALPRSRPGRRSPGAPIST